MNGELKGLSCELVVSVLLQSFSNVCKRSRIARCTSSSVSIVFGSNFIKLFLSLSEKSFHFVPSDQTLFLSTHAYQYRKWPTKAQLQKGREKWLQRSTSQKSFGRYVKFFVRLLLGIGDRIRTGTCFIKGINCISKRMYWSSQSTQIRKFVTFSLVLISCSQAARALSLIACEE